MLGDCSPLRADSHDVDSHPVAQWSSRPFGPLKLVFGDAPPWVPQAFLRAALPERVAMTVTATVGLLILCYQLLVIVLVIVGVDQLPGFRFSRLVTGPAIVLFAGACWLIPMLAKRRFAKRVRARDFRICGTCGYSLIGLPDCYQCPECGSAYDANELRNNWLAWLGPWEEKKEKQKERR